MKVLHLLDTLNRGGAEMQALDVAKNAEKHGIELTVVASGGGALEADFAASGAHFIRLQRKLPVDLYLASQIRKIIKEREISIIHGNQPVDGLHAYLACGGMNNVKKVLTFHGFIPDKKNRLTARFLIPKMSANLVVSRGLRKWLAETDGLNTKDFTVVYNGTDASRLKPTGKSLRSELKIPAGDALIGMISNFYRDPRKDQLTVCRSLPAVLAKFPHLQCIFAGGVEDGAEEKMADCINFCIENKIIDRVHFLGSRSDVPDILKELDIFVFSSLQEGLPVAIAEAMLAGVPLIVSDIEPLLEATANGKFGEVFPVGNDEILGEKLVQLLQNKPRRLELAASSKHYAKANFSIESHLAALKNLYTSLI